MKTVTLPLALQPPNPTVPLRAVHLTDAESLRTYCWPNRSLITVHNLIKRAHRNQKDRRGLGLVLIDQHDRALGYGQFTVWPTCAEISDLVIAEPLRGHGLGTTLIQALVQQAGHYGKTTFEIGVEVANTRAAKLYKHLGFVYSHSITVDMDHKPSKVLFMRLEHPVSQSLS
ncbi:MAG: GNAT family N-acetyltransferase [Anaerolineae bacterium]